MPTPAETLELALEHHRSGDLQRAVQLYQQILQAEPDHVDALCCLGVACLSLGKPTEAVDYYQHALRVQPDHAGALCERRHRLCPASPAR